MLYFILVLKIKIRGMINHNPNRDSNCDQIMK